MSFKELFSLILHVISSWKVIVTFVAMIMIISFAKYVTVYTKKPGKDKKAKKAAVVKAPAPEGEAKSEEAAASEA